MKREIEATGKTVEAAVSAGAEELGVDVASVTYEVLEQPKKGFLGFGETLAKVRVEYVVTPENTALEFLRTVIRDMDLRATVDITADYKAKRDRLLSVSGEDAGILIGHHGETLEALQYLVNLAANRREDDDESTYTRFTLDIEGYREKREDTLRRLAHRMAQRALKTGKNVALEPMNPSERRIIHSEVQGIEGVTTSSVGTDSNRRVVIYLEGGEIPTESKSRRASKRRPPKRLTRVDTSAPEDTDEPIFDEDD